MVVANKVAKELDVHPRVDKDGKERQEGDPGGFRLVVNDGPDGQQTVRWLHVHVIGGRKFKWPPG